MTLAIRLRDVQQRLVLLVACHVALAMVVSFEVFTEATPLSLSPLGAMYVAVATFGITVLAGVCEGASWSRIPLLILCLLSLPSCPLNFFALGILLLLLTGPRPRLLTAEFQRELALHGFPKHRRQDIWLWLVGIVFIYLSVWIFLHR